MRSDPRTGGPRPRDAAPPHAAGRPALRLPGRILACAGLLLCAPPALAAQGVSPAGDGGLVLQLEHPFADSLERVTVTLERGIAYRISVTGSGTPVFEDARRRREAAFVLPLPQAADEPPRRFEVYPYRTGAWALRLSGLPPGATASLRLYRDSAETRRTQPVERPLTYGVQLGAGWHTGYRVDSTGGSPPKGGTDWDACILVEIRDRVGLCVGLGEQSFPATGFPVHWSFLEARARILSAHPLGTDRTDLAAALRYSETEGVGTGNANPEQLAYGLYLTQHLAATHHGWSLYAAWQHGRLRRAPTSNRRDSDRFMAGVSWVR